MRHLPGVYFCLSFLIIISVGGCGYRFGWENREKNVLNEDSIRIGKVRNETPYNSLGIILGETLKNVMIENGYNGTFDGKADYLILGSVLQVKERPVGFSDDGFGLEYEISCSVLLELIDSGTGENVFDLKNFVANTTYYSGPDPTYTRTNRERALEFVITKISTRFVDILKEI